MGMSLQSHMHPSLASHSPLHTAASHPPGFGFEFQALKASAYEAGAGPDPGPEYIDVIKVGRRTAQCVHVLMRCVRSGVCLHCRVLRFTSGGACRRPVSWLF